MASRRRFYRNRVQRLQLLRECRSSRDCGGAEAVRLDLRRPHELHQVPNNLHACVSRIMHEPHQVPNHLHACVSRIMHEPRQVPNNLHACVSRIMLMPYVKAPTASVSMNQSRGSSP